MPIMVFFAVGMDRLDIIAISLFLSFMTQLPAFIMHYKNGLVKVRLGLLFAAATIPGVVIGVLVGIRTADVVAYCMFSILLFITGSKMVYDIYKKRFDNVTKDRKHSTDQIALVFMISIGTGMVSAFFGVGGGIITVPVLVYILGLYTRRAIGTSALMIVITSMVGFVCYSLLSINQFPNAVQIHFELAAILGLPVLIGAYLGSSWGLKALKTKNIQVVFVIIIFIVGVQLLLRVLGYI